MSETGLTSAVVTIVEHSVLICLEHELPGCARCQRAGSPFRETAWQPLLKLMAWSVYKHEPGEPPPPDRDPFTSCPWCFQAVRVSERAEHDKRHARTEREKALRTFEAAGVVEALECTGLAASWCPLCGDCACKRDLKTGERYGESEPDSNVEACPLHRPGSSHRAVT